MGMNDTPSGERVHIGLFGRTNAGKSSLMNALLGQSLAVVSATKGTTTDPVKKAMELLPIGPVVFIDTPGLDDEGSLGASRMEKAYQMMHQVDVALLVLDGRQTYPRDLDLEKELFTKLNQSKVLTFIVVNKTESMTEQEKSTLTTYFHQEFPELAEDRLHFVTALETENVTAKEQIYALREAIARQNIVEEERRLVGDLIAPQDVAILVVPIDSAAPKGRLILPQQQVIRDILESGGMPLVVRDTELAAALDALKNPPRIVITDSQAFHEVAAIVPPEIPLTSFSILMARYKGDLDIQIEGARTIDQLKEGSRILICEGCTHHRQCDDIGTIKLPRWISEYTKKQMEFHFTSGGEFPRNLQEYDLIIHCGGCTLPLREVRFRMQQARQLQVPITNYGVFIAYINGILNRVTEPFA